MIDPELIVRYPTGDTGQLIKNSKQQHKSIKYELDTMVEVNNQLKNNIDLNVIYNYFKGITQVTLGFRNYTTIAEIQYFFNTFVWGGG